MKKSATYSPSSITRMLACLTLSLCVFFSAGRTAFIRHMLSPVSVSGNKITLAFAQESGKVVSLDICYLEEESSGETEESDPDGEVPGNGQPILKNEACVSLSLITYRSVERLRKIPLYILFHSWKSYLIIFTTN